MEQGNGQQSSEGSRREQAKDGDAGATVKRFCDCERVTETPPFVAYPKCEPKDPGSITLHSKCVWVNQRQSKTNLSASKAIPGIVWPHKLSFQLPILFSNVVLRWVHSFLQNRTKNFREVLSTVSSCKRWGVHLYQVFGHYQIQS